MAGQAGIEEEMRLALYPYRFLTLSHFMKRLTIAVGGDHAGYALKGAVIQFLKDEGHEVEDCGSYDPAPVDFPDIAQLVCQRVLEGKAQRGVMVCGTGVGACIAANKSGVFRASVGHDIFSAHQCVGQDDVNGACPGPKIMGIKIAE